MVEKSPLYGGRLPDVDGKRWVGDESWGHFEDEKGRWVDAVPIDTKPPRVQILNAGPPPFIGRYHPV